ncbi:DUF2513 domain-containing protein [Vibrio parahaemolyticus]|nr:DUF2513 domain-containing protein [Vibrio parahaemolyticus]ELA7163856.1 DUF2513 domain-containing protein [Vibrio parahaemolyticus]MDG3002027.1 DUF2513 domain-containing protein [Vibrio parahaemolyticus]MDG3039538.1 DUF2513 domain-containing protein [Vibrio parahaemolyticus]
MKRDLELVVQILELLENRQEISIIQTLHVQNYDDNVVAYHLRRMFEAGLLDAESVVSTTSPERIISVYPFGLSWGHEFLDCIRSKSVMAKVKSRLGGAIIDVPFSVVKSLALSYAKEKFGL